MTTNVRAVLQNNTTSPESLYLAPATLSEGTRIVAFTVVNTTGSPETYSVYIVPIGGSGDTGNTLIYEYTIAAGDSQSPPEVQNQLIPKTYSLYVQSSASDALTFTFSGLEF